MKQLWGAVFLLAVLVGAGWAATLGQTTTLDLETRARFAAMEVELLKVATHAGGTTGALRIAEARIDDLERRVRALETTKPKPTPAKRPTPVFARCGRIGC